MNIYGYAGCSTVKKAVQWAEAQNLNADYAHFNKVEELEALLKVWVDKAGIEKVFNAKAQTFKKLDPEEQNQITQSQSSMIAAMAADPRFIKRPIGTDGKVVLTGFDIDEWEKAFA